MAALSPTSHPQDKHITPTEAVLPNWKLDILEKKRRAKEAELLMKEEENLKKKFIPEWKRELIKRTRSTQVPVFKMATPLLPIPSSPPSVPPIDPSPKQQQDYPPLPPWIREKLSKVANELKSEQQSTLTSDTDSQNLPHVVQEIVNKFSSIPPPLPSPSAVTSQQIPEVNYDHNLMDDSSLANLPDWKRNIIVRRRRGQVLKRLSLTKDDLDMISSRNKSPAKSTPDKVDIQLQNMSDKRELDERKLEMKKTQENVKVDTTIDKSNTNIKSAGIPRTFFVTQEPQMKVKELLDKFAPIPNMTPSVMLFPSVPKSMRIAKRPPPPPPTTPTKQIVTSSPASNKTEAPDKLPLSPEVILTVEEYNRHHALLVQALASQISPSMVNGNEDMFNFIIPENTPSKRARTLSPDTPISSVDPYTKVTDISQPLYLPPKYEYPPHDVPEISMNNEKHIDISLEEVTLSYIDEVNDESVVPIHRPISPDQVPLVPWRDTLEKIKSKRKERVPSDIYENVIIVSTHEVPILKSSLKTPGVRSQRGRIHFSDTIPSVYQYPKLEVEEGFGNINSFSANQEELSHRLHPSISSARQAQSDKLQNYTPAILDYFDSLVSTPAQPVWMQGEQDEDQSPSRDESDEVIDSFTAVPVDFEDELDMSNLSDRAAAMIW
ncbi:hypothetical protein LOD99_1674 [Oopsacas minuta]|uniref:Uncharacterized protein n=1 Tax=Oopsacas minuta TaxID=111878 RepID=A0AAV7K558_9METZ|nr:hypothetical protein LOD99_1674 [Oopsacas minuta]